MKKKDKITAARIAFFFGGFGGHKFYLGYWFQGILYLLFFWTLIPVILGLFEGMAYAAMADDEFESKYLNRKRFAGRRKKD